LTEGCLKIGQNIIADNDIVGRIGFSNEALALAA